MTFTGRSFEDQSDRSSWARSVEGRLAKVQAGLLRFADLASDIFGTAAELGLANTAGSARSIARSDHVHRAPGFSYFRGANINNGTATVFTTFRTDNALGSLPVAYKMVVQGIAICGGNAGANKCNLSLLDETGAVISWRAAGAFTLAETTFSSHPGFDLPQTVPILGTKDYAANAVCGWRLAYKVNTSNIYIDAGVRIDLIPLAQTHSA